MAVVGEAPGRNEVEQGVPFIGAAGEMLDQLLLDAGMPRSRVYISNALLCLPPGGNLDDFISAEKRRCKDVDKEFSDPIDHCRPRLFRELGIERCQKCKKWRYGPDAHRCVCRRPDYVRWEHRAPPKVIVPVGNAAMQALLGWTGIQAWRGSPVEALQGPGSWGRWLARMKTSRDVGVQENAE